MPNYRSPALRTTAAALMAAVLDDLAARDLVPVVGPMDDYRRWWRYGQEPFVALRPHAWHMPERVGMVGWLDSFPHMAAVRAAIDADPSLGARVDTAVGTEFSLQHRRLDWQLVEHLLEPMVVQTRAYQFDEAVFDARYAGVEAGLFAREVRLVEFLPLNGFTSSLEELQLPDGLVLRPMTDRQISEAIRVLAVPAEFGGGPNNVQVSRFHQWALITERTYPVRSHKQGMPEHPATPPFPTQEDASTRLVMALRIVCGGSAVTTRLIRMQHDDDFPMGIGGVAALSAIGTADLGRPTPLLTSDQVDAAREVYQLLDAPAVREDRALQTALRRLVFAGARTLPADRLIDLMTCAEALFIKRAKITGNAKAAPIATRADRLLVGDAVVAAGEGDVEQLMKAAYRLRNAEIHGDDPTAAKNMRLLTGTNIDAVDRLIEDVERVLRRAIHLTLADAATPRPSCAP